MFNNCKKHLLIAFLLFNSVTFRANEELVLPDSLKTQLNTNIQADKINAYTVIMDFYQANSDSAIKYGNEAIKFARENDYLLGEAAVKLKLGDVYHLLGDYTISRKYYKFASDSFRELGENDEYGRSLNKISVSLDVQGDYDSALNYCLQSIRILEALGNDKYLAYSYNHLAILYYIIEDYTLAEKEGIKALKFCEKLDDLSAIATAHEHLFIIYSEIMKLDKAMFHLNKAFELNKKRGNKVAISGTLGNFALLYSKKGEYEKAQDYYYKSLELKKELKHKRGIGAAYLGLALTYREMNDLDKCLFYLKKSYEVRNEIEDKRGLVSTLKRLVDVSREKKNFEEAFYYAVEMYTYKDILLNESKQRELVKLQNSFEVDKQNKEMLLLQKENQIEKNRVNYLLIIIGILLIFSIVIVRLNITKRNLIATKDKFFSIISHDLKSPFQGLLGIVQVLYEDVNKLPKEEIKENILILKNSSHKLYELLDNLLEWSQLQGESIQMHQENINFKSLVEGVISDFTLSAEYKQINLINKVESDIVVKADENMLRSIMRNLISNAIKFSFNGSKIEIESIVKENSVEISVRDYGIGIPEKMISMLFKKGKNTSRVGTSGESSSGLGLMLCKEYLRMHKGNITAQSPDGKGTQFTFNLPK